MPPLPPPNGMCATAHFHVIHAASAVTSSSVTPGVVADAALGRSERHAVLHAVAGEDFDLAVVHLHRARDRDLPLGMREDLPDARLEIEKPRGVVELLEHRVEDRSVGHHRS